jgi:bifunctional DNA-binding transcriptional regulator/antitoxin component of YhaV-PrlF toxin-antitoxin module
VSAPLVERSQDLAFTILAYRLFSLCLSGEPGMRITSKRQVTIPQEVRNRLGQLPHTEVEFEVSGDHARSRKARCSEGAGVPVQKALTALRGSVDTRMSTDEMMALTCGSRPPARTESEQGAA